MRKSRHHDIDDAGLGKAAATSLFNHLKVADIAKGVGDPQCYQGQAGEARFKVGDKLRVKDHPDLFYNQTPGYLRGVIGTVTKLVYESPAPEDEAWGHIDKVEWFYALLFRHEDVWTDDGPDTNPNDTIHAQVSERWLEPV